MPLIEILTSTDPHQGLGNLRRSLYLKCELESLGFECILTGSYFEHTKLNSIPRLLICDVPLGLQNSKESVLECSKNVIFLVGIDWFGKETPLYNFSIFPRMRLKASKRMYTGLEYAFIRKEIKNIQKLYILENSTTLITLGATGTEIAVNLHSQLLDKMQKVITVISGIDSEESLGDNSIMYNPENFEELIGNSSQVITNGGLVCLESVYLGKSVHSIPLNINETYFVSRLKNNVGSISIYRKSNLYDVVDGVVNSKDNFEIPKIKSFSALGYETVVEICSQEE